MMTRPSFGPIIERELRLRKTDWINVVGMVPAYAVAACGMVMLIVFLMIAITATSEQLQRWLTFA